MAVKRRGGKWVVEFMQAGHRVFKRLPAEASRKDALDYEAKLRREIFDQRTLGKKPEVTIAYATRLWLSETVGGRKAEKATTSHANRVIEEVGTKSCRFVESAGGQLRTSAKRSCGGDKPISNATLNRRLCILKAVAKFAWRKGWTEENLSARIQLLPEDNARHVYLSQEQVSALIEAAPTPEGKAFIAFAAFTGMRQGEIMALTSEDIGSDYLAIRDSKAGEPRRIPIVEGLREYLSFIPFAKHKRTLYADFEEARKSLLLPVRYHDLRHTTASLMIQAGAPLYTVGEILGHKSTQTTKRYAHLAMENKREALDKAFPSHQDYSGQPPENEDK